LLDATRIESGLLLPIMLYSADQLAFQFDKVPQAVDAKPYVKRPITTYPLLCQPTKTSGCQTVLPKPNHPSSLKQPWCTRIGYSKGVLKHECGRYRPIADAHRYLKERLVVEKAAILAAGPHPR
jgi:hypothetical protein